MILGSVFESGNVTPEKSQINLVKKSKELSSTPRRPPLHSPSAPNASIPKPTARRSFENNSPDGNRRAIVFSVSKWDTCCVNCSRTKLEALGICKMVA